MAQDSPAPSEAQKFEPQIGQTDQTTSQLSSLQLSSQSFVGYQDAWSIVEHPGDAAGPDRLPSCGTPPARKVDFLSELSFSFVSVDPPNSHAGIYNPRKTTSTRIKQNVQGLREAGQLSIPLHSPLESAIHSKRTPSSFWDESISWTHYTNDGQSLEDPSPCGSVRSPPFVPDTAARGHRPLARGLSYPEMVVIGIGEQFAQYG
jgi:hypothetical protein